MAFLASISLFLYSMPRKSDTKSTATSTDKSTPTSTDNSTPISTDKSTGQVYRQFYRTSYSHFPQTSLQDKVYRIRSYSHFHSHFHRQATATSTAEDLERSPPRASTTALFSLRAFLKGS